MSDVQLKRCPSQVKLSLPSHVVTGISRWTLSSGGLLHHSLICVFRPASESLTDRFALMDYEARRLLSAIVKNMVQMTAEELEPTSDDSRYELLSGLSERVYLKRPTSAFILREVVTVDPVSEVRSPWRFVLKSLCPDEVHIFLHFSNAGNPVCLS